MPERAPHFWDTSTWVPCLAVMLCFGCDLNVSPTVRECRPSGACESLLKKPIQEKQIMPFSSKGGDALAGKDTWQELCATCHGETGKGGMSMGGPVPDLTTERFQRTTEDARIADVILHGKGRMPSFTFDETTLKNLVRHVRTLTQKSQGY